MNRRAWGAGAGALVVLTLFTAALAAADSLTPVVLNIRIARVARRGVPLRLTVGITADVDALDGASPLWLRAKLAGECGGTYAGTRGPVLVNRLLSPQPATGAAYATTVSGSGRPAAYGVQIVCVFLEEQGDDRVYASSQAVQVDVSAPCTAAAARYDAARAMLTRARRRRRGVPRAVNVAARDKRVAARACGSGVPL